MEVTQCFLSKKGLFHLYLNVNFCSARVRGDVHAVVSEARVYFNEMNSYQRYCIAFILLISSNFFFLT